MFFLLQYRTCLVSTDSNVTALGLGKMYRRRNVTLRANIDNEGWVWSTVKTPAGSVASTGTDGASR